MKTVIFEVRPLTESLADFADTWQTGSGDGKPRIGFASAELMSTIMTARRWETIRAMMGAGALSIRELARRLGRDVKTVHGDVQALLKAGVIDKTGAGLIEFPYDAVHVDFTLKAA